MPDSLKLHSKVCCPRCGAHLLNSSRFQWGIMPGSTYDIGDHVNWLHNNNGEVIAPFTLTLLDGHQLRWNCGSPDFKNVVLFDLDVYTGNHQLTCHSCEADITAVIAIVENGTFAKVQAILDADVEYILGSHRDKADIIVIRDDGTYWPREDWYDHPIEYTAATFQKK